MGNSLAVLARHVPGTEAGVALEASEACGAVAAAVDLAHVHLHLTPLTSEAQLTLTLESPVQAGAVSKDTGAGVAAVSEVLTHRTRPLGRTFTLVQVEQVPAQAPVVAGVWRTHTFAPAAVLSSSIGVPPHKLLLLRPGEV